MKKNPWMMFFLLCFIFGTLFLFMLGSSAISLFGRSETKVASKNSILHIELEGIILDGRKFIKQLVKYRKDNHIKAIVIEVNSPGGVVGPSQEIYQEIKRTREVYKKPVVVVSTALNASGAFYASMAADKIMVAPGTLIGSIGVIMEFTNLEKLYEWAKVSRYSLTTGKFKDSGAEYRPMREDEKEYFQSLINDVLEQFKKAVVDGRNLKPEDVTAIADGRVMNGAQAIKLGLADQEGTLEDGFKLAADLAKLGDNYEIFEPPKNRPGLLEILNGDEEEAHSKVNPGKVLSQVLRLELANKPLFLMPGSY